MKLIKFCLGALLSTSEAIHVQNRDVPRSSAEQITEDDSEKQAKVTAPNKFESLDQPLFVDKDQAAILAEAEEDEDIPEFDKSLVESQKNDISFSRSFDHIGYGGSKNLQDAARIQFDVKIKAGGSKTCIQDDWAIIHYKMWSLEDGQLLEDTKMTHPDEPLHFLVGHYQVSKCLEIAVQMMKVYDTAMIHCPNDLDLGGQIGNDWHNKFGNPWVSTKIDTRYKITLLDCDPNPVAFQMQSKDTLKDNEPFYLLTKNMDTSGNLMALTINTTDVYAPKVTGVHNVKLLAWNGFEKNDPLQQWLYNEEEGNIMSVGSKGDALFEGFNKNVIAYKYKNLPNQKFKFNIGTQRLQNQMTGNAVDTSKQVIQSDQNVVTDEPNASQSQMWQIVYQKQHEDEKEEKDKKDKKVQK